MNHGDKVYRCSGTELITATFLEESVLPGAQLPTWLIRDADGRRGRCSPSMYKPTAEEAYSVELALYRNALPDMEQQLVELKAGIEETRATIARLEKLAGTKVLSGSR